MKRVQRNRELLSGSLVALLATISGFVLYVEIFVKLPYNEVFEHVVEKGLHGEIMTLSALPNLFVFFGFLRKNQEERAKGVLLLCLLLALAIFVIKFL